MMLSNCYKHEDETGSSVGNDELLSLATGLSSELQPNVKLWIELTSYFPYIQHSFNSSKPALSGSRCTVCCDQRVELKEILEDKNEKEIANRFQSRLEFGTGVCFYLLDNYSLKECRSRGIVIGHDARYNSKRFAHVAAAVSVSYGFKVYLFQQIVATPLLAYSIVKKNCLAGVMVTASHNPKQDNGYKLYAGNGIQIIPPMDKQISNWIIKKQADCPDGAVKLINKFTGLLLDASKYTIDPYDDIVGQYMNDAKNELSCYRDCVSKSSLRIVYTALHGVGSPFVLRIAKLFGFDNLVEVTSQCEPDPDFPTVSFPNPEETGALELSYAAADKENCSMILANDPDADRFACAEKVNGKWRQFTGDEVGILFAHYVLENHGGALKKSQKLFTTTAVSSRMLERLARTEGCPYEETMTGFKWIMNCAYARAAAEGLSPLFGYEEALGYAIGTGVRDKDGITAAGVWIEMACRLYNAGETVHQHLAALRKKYGYFINNNSYFLCYEKEHIAKLFDEFRNNGNYKWKLGNFDIQHIRDVTTGYDSRMKDFKCTFPLTPDSQMVTLYFTNSAVLTLRTSGTEPKIKWYSEIRGDAPDSASAILQGVVDSVKNHLLQPSKYPLFPPKN